MTRLAAEVPFLMTGDAQMRDEIQSCRPPGGKHLVPDAEVIRAREVSKQQFLQAQRTKKGVAFQDDDDGAGAAAAATRRRRKRGGRGKGDGKGDGKGGAAPPQR